MSHKLFFREKMAQIPSIDLTGFNLQSDDNEKKKKIGGLMVDAFRKFGAVRLEGSGLGLKDEIMRKTHFAYQKIFSSSDEEKEKHKMKPNLQGYVMFKDSMQGDANHREEHFQVRGASLGIDDKEQYPWPDSLAPGFSSIAREFILKSEALALGLLEALALGLGLEKSHFTKVHSSLRNEGSLTTMGCMNCTCAHGSGNNDLWHKQRSIFTTIGLLFQDAMGGTRFQGLDDGEFTDAHCGDDDVYVVVGDVLEIWSNGMMRSPNYKRVVTCSHEGHKPARQMFLYYVASDNNAVACDLKIESRDPLEIITAISNDQCTAYKVIMKKLKPMADILSKC